MSQSLAAFLLMALLLVGCEPDSSQNLNDDLIDRYVETHPVDEILSSHSMAAANNSEQKFSGEWLYINDDRVCDGYLTRNASEEFCEVNIPEDWRPFAYDGKTYFVQPLSMDIR